MNDPEKEGRGGTGSRGNASNPLPAGAVPEQHDQLLNEKAETYLREGGNIEDMPDAQEAQEAEDLTRGEGA